MEKIDIAIIGSGPAGISAAINAKIRRKSFVLFGSNNLSTKVGVSEKIDNYPGFPHITGKKLNKQFHEHLKQMDITITEKQVTAIYPMGDYFAIFSNEEQYNAKAIILAMGVEAVKPLEGEREFLGRGVSYCATCDGTLYRNKKIAIVCDNEEMEEEVDYLANLAKEVLYQPLFKSSYQKDNVTRLPSLISSISGDLKVRKITLKNNESIDVDGIFFLKRSVSADVLLNTLEAKDGQIVVNKNMETNIAGCFACGDCTGRPYQISKAVGEGNIAAHSAIAYLANNKNDGE